MQNCAGSQTTFSLEKVIVSRTPLNAFCHVKFYAHLEIGLIAEVLAQLCHID